MAKIIREATVGNEAQNADCVVTVSPGSDGIQIYLKSLVKNQFGEAIKATVRDELRCFDICDADISIEDRGAIDPVLRARLECAIKRGMEA